MRFAKPWIKSSGFSIGAGNTNRPSGSPISPHAGVSSGTSTVNCFSTNVVVFFAFRALIPCRTIHLVGKSSIRMGLIKRNPMPTSTGLLCFFLTIVVFQLRVKQLPYLPRPQERWFTEYSKNARFSRLARLLSSVIVNVILLQPSSAMIHAPIRDTEPHGVAHFPPAITRAASSKSGRAQNQIPMCSLQSLTCLQVKVLPRRGMVWAE